MGFKSKLKMRLVIAIKEKQMRHCPETRIKKIATAAAEI